MSDRLNCPVHGLQLVDDYSEGCPRCRFAEEDAARDREEIRKSLSEIARTSQAAVEAAAEAARPDRTFDQRLEKEFHEHRQNGLITDLDAVIPARQSRYEVRVDYDCSLVKMITDGNYDWSFLQSKSDPYKISLAFNVDVTGMTDVTIELVHFGQDIDGDVACKSLRAIGLRAASLSELLALGASLPDLQRAHPIVALGTVIGSYDVAYLYGDDSRRSVLLTGFSGRSGRWDDTFRFAGMRASPNA